MFVVDCSVTMAWLFEDEKTVFTENMLQKLEQERAVVPSLWCLEVMNVLLVAEKRKRCSLVQSVHFLETLRTLPIEIDTRSGIEQNGSLLLLARAHGLSSYDAAYLDVALRHGCPLATLDSDLRKACQSLGITVFL